MGRIYIKLRDVFFVSNTKSLPQDGQRLISKVKEDAKSHKAFEFEFEDHKHRVESERTMDEKLYEYRKQLIEIEQKVGESFLKTILTLSGGALGISFVFIKDVIGEGPMRCSATIITAWSFLTISLALVLSSLYVGTFTYRRAIKQVDNGTIYEQVPGGKMAKLMPILNFLSTFCFVSGVIFLFIFAFKNLGG